MLVYGRTSVEALVFGGLGGSERYEGGSLRPTRGSSPRVTGGPRGGCARPVLRSGAGRAGRGGSREKALTSLKQATLSGRVVGRLESRLL